MKTIWRRIRIEKRDVPREWSITRKQDVEHTLGYTVVTSAREAIEYSRAVYKIEGHPIGEEDKIQHFQMAHSDYSRKRRKYMFNITDEQYDELIILYNEKKQASRAFYSFLEQIQEK